MDKVIENVLALGLLTKEVKKVIESAPEIVNNKEFMDLFYEFIDLSTEVIMQQSIDCQILLVNSEDLIEGRKNFDEFKVLIEETFGQLIADSKMIAQKVKDLTTSGGITQADSLKILEDLKQDSKTTTNFLPETSKKKQNLN